ncbi:MAG: hypothetical protein KDA76_12220 [Planctomycetaceae bacterium]|nr:hypothetical protein [Planctomycetaceae bacterium]
MSDDGVMFHADDAPRIARAVRHYEDSLTRLPSGRRRAMDGEAREGLVVRTHASHGVGQTKLCQVLVGTPGSESESGEEVLCTNLFAALSSAIAIAVPCGTGYYLVAARCPSPEES